jgi:hypothetical protein
VVITKLMKPVVRRYRAATQVNVVSSEIVVVEETDSVSWLERSMQTSVIGEAGCAPAESQTVARYRMEYEGIWEEGNRCQVNNPPGK